MKYTLKTAPTTLAVSVADVKEQLRIESYGDHDAMIQSYIQGSTKTLEQKANLCLQAQTWTAYYTPSEVLERIFLYKYPITAINSIKYYDSDNALQTISSDDYTTIFTLRPSEVIFDDPPSVYDRSDALQIEFVAGFTTVPDDIILAIKHRVYKEYNNPDDFVEMKQTYFDKIIRDYRSYEE